MNHSGRIPSPSAPAYSTNGHPRSVAQGAMSTPRETHKRIEPHRLHPLIVEDVSDSHPRVNRLPQTVVAPARHGMRIGRGSLRTEVDRALSTSLLQRRVAVAGLLIVLAVLASLPFRELMTIQAARRFGLAVYCSANTVQVSAAVARRSRPFFTRSSTSIALWTLYFPERGLAGRRIWKYK